MVVDMVVVAGWSTIVCWTIDMTINNWWMDHVIVVVLMVDGQNFMDNKNIHGWLHNLSMKFINKICYGGLYLLLQKSWW